MNIRRLLLHVARRPRFAAPGGVATTPVRDGADVQAFFDRCAAAYSEQHGHPEKLLAARLALVRTHAHLRGDDEVLDVGCGNGHHLFALAPELGRATGVDLSPGMIALGQARLRAAPAETRARLAFQVGDAAGLPGIADASFDLALCIGALEHMLDKPAALRAIHRVLRPGGRFFCLTPAGDYLWYRTLAPLGGLSTKHLSTDTFLTAAEFGALVDRAGFSRWDTGAWTFIPKGDMPRAAGALLQGLDAIGRHTRLPGLRGGMWICAWKG